MTDTAKLTLECLNCPHCGVALRYGRGGMYTTAIIVKDRDSGKATIQCPSCGKEDPR